MRYSNRLRFSDYFKFKAVLYDINQRVIGNINRRVIGNMFDLNASYIPGGEAGGR